MTTSTKAETVNSRLYCVMYAIATSNSYREALAALEMASELLELPRCDADSAVAWFAVNAAQLKLESFIGE